jgi:hypothetical protein
VEVRAEERTTWRSGTRLPLQQRGSGPDAGRFACLGSFHVEEMPERERERKIEREVDGKRRWQRLEHEKA